MSALHVSRFLFAGLLSTILTAPVHAATLPSGFSETRVATGLASPTAMAFAPDGRLFVAQQGGALRVIKNGALLAQPFLTLNVDSNGERGLLGVAFDPNFAVNRFVYVYYTTSTSPVHNRLSRFTASASNPDVVAAGSEVQLLNLPSLSSATNHNGGAIHFGADGKLYVAVGDNANSANSPSLDTTLGKVLRINSDGSIPADNPFLGQTTGINQLIWARGLRNPFNFAVDRDTGRIHVNDVGQSSWEEVNHAIAGANFGWPQTEGPNPPGIAGVRYPIHAYENAGSSCAITGAAFYRPDTVTFPQDYAGRYFFGDFCGGFIRMLSPPNYSAATSFATGIASLVDLQVSADGALWYLARGNGGEVFRVQFSGAVMPGISSHPASITVAAGQTASFSVTATGTAPLQYQWQRNGVDIPNANAPAYSFATTAADNGATFRARVSNAAGSVLSNPATLTVTSGTTTLFSDDLEVDRGWTATPGINTATLGNWQRGDPQPTSSEGVSLQPGSCDASVNCFVTELAAGSVAWSRDVDGGLTSIQSPAITLPAGGTVTLRFRYFFAHLANATGADLFRVRVVGANGTPLTVFARGGAATNRAGVWSNGSANLSAYAGQTIRLRVEAYDANPASLIEAGIDNVVVTRQ
jgi:glucose/arabinose dehydrogenase